MFYPNMSTDIISTMTFAQKAEIMRDSMLWQKEQLRKDLTSTELPPDGDKDHNPPSTTKSSGDINTMTFAQKADMMRDSMQWQKEQLRKELPPTPHQDEDPFQDSPFFKNADRIKEEMLRHNEEVGNTMKILKRLVSLFYKKC